MRAPAETQLSRLRALFGDARDSLRITDGGIFLATPVAIVAAAMEQIATHGLCRPGAAILDAGAGDGRVVAALALAFGARSARVYGVECDEDLARDAAQIAEALDLPTRARVVRGDFLGTAAFEELGVAFASFDLVLHYPDGNERALFDRMAREGKEDALLLLLSPQIGGLLETPPERRVEVRAEGEPFAWYLGVHRPRASIDGPRGR